ncbi:hypothetical protein M440DRAFT_1465524 [Trichoderma longibrachiatum ATCC 18648]|uniref:Uncharacterized protein n=1 Tax=Trichoderma longibrachiatum ATCC 18648 TaxID=983965 RepID=A0A2T4BUL3_TRILO|nr:hypothetical protein M440DRAFT_1465524 [Trichoderma longibrachiatum ATCC 18648]
MTVERHQAGSKDEHRLRVCPTHPSLQEVVAGAMHDSLVRELEGVARDREEATPDIDFPDAAETCYQWKCEELHNHFRPHEADRYPMAIDQREYWELEYLHYLDALQKRLLHKARLSQAYCKNLLRHSGLSATQIREVRQSIDSQEYWKLEAELFERRTGATASHTAQEDIGCGDQTCHAVPSSSPTRTSSGQHRKQDKVPHAPQCRGRETRVIWAPDWALKLQVASRSGTPPSSGGITAPLACEHCEHINSFPAFPFNSYQVNMSSDETKDLSRVVLILGLFAGVKNVLELSENSRYEFTRQRTAPMPLVRVVNLTPKDSAAMSVPKIWGTCI